MKNLIKKIGKGPKLAKDLTQEEAKAALTQILNGEAQPHQIGAFLIAERIKGESAEETAGFVQALQDFSTKIPVNVPKLLELAGAHDGKNKSLVLSPFIAMILSCAGVPTVVTGGKDVPTKKGICARNIFDELGIKTNGDAGHVKNMLEATGIAYWDVSHYCPSLESRKEIRTSLGLRTTLNTVEKLINPASANYLCTGVFHGPYLKDVSEACQLLEYKNVLCIQATEASTDLPLKKRVFYRLVKNNTVSDQLEIKPKDFDFERETNPGFEKILAQSNTESVLRALKDQKGIVYDALVYNAGVQLWFTESVPSILEGINKAKKIMGSEQVFAKLEDLKSY